MPDSQHQHVRVGLFVTCVVDLFRPGVAIAAAKLLDQAGYVVVVPAHQQCCGQPALSAGDEEEARAMARDAIAAFEGFDHVVAPSGACARTLKIHYPALFADDRHWHARASAFAARVHELTSFLVDVAGVTGINARVEGSVTYQDCCAGLRDLGIAEQPRRLLGAVDGLTLHEMEAAGACCGLDGGCRGEAAESKTRHIRASGAGTLLAGDLGCLMNLAGRLKREGSAIEVRHVAEVLAGMNDTPPIGGVRDGRATRQNDKNNFTGRPRTT